MIQSNGPGANVLFSDPAARREGADAVLAKNLVVARTLIGLTQQELAALSRVSRATIAQLETGYSDPRLSTVVELATALGLPPIFLLLGVEEVRALAALLQPPQSPTTPAESPLPLKVPASALAQMQDYVQSGMLKDRLRAARVGAAVARASGAAAAAAPVTAGIFSAILPGAGTVVGTALAELLARKA